MIRNACTVCISGYGHITPKTQWGKVVCMVYSLLGIPIMVLFLTNIGEIMASLFRFIYMNLCCCRCFLHARKSKNCEQKSASQVTHIGVPMQVFDDSGPRPPPKVTN